jgi:hypothetical protein
MQFRIHKFSHAFNTEDMDYKGLTKFTLVDQHVGFSCEGYKFGCINAELRIVSSALTFYRPNIGP